MALSASGITPLNVKVSLVDLQNASVCMTGVDVVNTITSIQNLVLMNQKIISTLQGNPFRNLTADGYLKFIEAKK